MRRKGPVLLGAVLDEFLKNIGVERKVKEGMVLERWNEVVGPYIAKVSKADRINNFNLKFRKEQSLSVFEINNLAQKIKEKHLNGIRI